VASRRGRRSCRRGDGRVILPTSINRPASPLGERFSKKSEAKASLFFVSRLVRNEVRTDSVSIGGNRVAATARGGPDFSSVRVRQIFPKIGQNRVTKPHFTKTIKERRLFRVGLLVDFGQVLVLTPEFLLAASTE
jgi:hypothetical protein